jgi:hypothetical protein
VRVIYNNQDLGLVKCHKCDNDGELDPTHKDLLYHTVDLVVEGKVNPFMTSSGKANPGPFGSYGIEGDRLGIALNRLKDALKTPRQSLQVYIGADLIFDVPGTTVGTKAALVCDPIGGPIPESFDFTDIDGDKTATFVFHIRFAVSQCNRFVLSNRWTSKEATDKDGMVVRTLSGKAILRLDYLNTLASTGVVNLTADSFRGGVVVPCPTWMRRYGVDVAENEDGSVLDWSVTDKQYNYAIGPLGAGITRVEGMVTAGAVSPMKTPGGGALMATAGASILDWFAGRSGFGTRADNALLAGAMWSSGLAQRVTANAVVRVYAWPFDDTLAPRGDGTRTLPGKEQLNSMVRCGMAIVYDRFSPIGVPGSNTLPMISCYVTQGVGSDETPFIEARMEFLYLNVVGLKAILNPDLAPNLLNMASYFVINFTGGTSARLDRKATTSPPVLPLSKNTRGNRVAPLFAAALNAQACTVPPIPKDPGNKDLPTTI